MKGVTVSIDRIVIDFTGVHWDFFNESQGVIDLNLLAAEQWQDAITVTCAVLTG